jgi:prepilin-type N-terminal cleavage/methylation domain-containing protein
MMGSERGYTLLELLVTVAIVSILSASAVQAFQSYRMRGYEAVAIRYLRTWGPAQEVYLLDNGEYANADEDLGHTGLKITKVPTNVPYDFSIDSGGGMTNRWWGRATPTKSGLRHFCISQYGIVRSGWIAQNCSSG